MLRHLVATALVAAAVGAHAAPAARAAGLPATQRSLEREMRQAGSAASALAIDLQSGEELYAAAPDVERVPASVEKVYTASAALLNWGAATRLQTLVLAPAPDAAGVVSGDIVLKGAGDPAFAGADVSALARAVARRGATAVTGRVIGDESAFDRFRGPPYSGLRLTSEVGPLSALAYDHGRTGGRSPYFQASPARFAAQAFSRALERAGVTVRGSARRGVATAGMVELARSGSPPLADLVRAMNVPSDNFYAETLVKGLGSAFGGAGSTAAGAAVVRRTLTRFGAAPEVVDGSGLSRQDRTSPRDVVRVLSGMLAQPQGAGRALARSLAVVGRTGTLRSRMRGTAAQDRCAAKTGTLTAVSALAGYCTSTGGRRVAFAVLMNDITIAKAHRLQDRMTAALARLDAAD